MGKKVAFVSLGCKVNQYETNAMSQEFIQAGYEVVEFTDVADVYIVNTCTVTNIADRKSRQMISRARKNNDKAIVVATGCYIQTAKEEKIRKELKIDIAVGNNKKGSVLKAVKEFENSGDRHIDIININSTIKGK